MFEQNNDWCLIWIEFFFFDCQWFFKVFDCGLMIFEFCVGIANIGISYCYWFAVIRGIKFLFNFEALEIVSECFVVNLLLGVDVSDAFKYFGDFEEVVVVVISEENFEWFFFFFFKMKKNITFINVQCFVVVLEMRLNIGLFEESESYFDIVLITANVFPDFEAFLQSLGCFEVLLLLNKESSEGVQWISNIGVHFSQLQFPDLQGVEQIFFGETVLA